MPRIFLCFALYLGIGSAPIAIREEGLQAVEMSNGIIDDVIAYCTSRHRDSILLRLNEG